MKDKPQQQQGYRADNSERLTQASSHMKQVAVGAHSHYRERLNAAITYFTCFFLHFSSHATLQKEALRLRADSGCTRPPGRPNNGVPTERGKRGLRFEASLPPLDHSPDVLSLSAALRRQRVNCQRQHDLSDNARPKAAARKQIYVNIHTPLPPPFPGTDHNVYKCETCYEPSAFQLLFRQLVAVEPSHVLPIAKGRNYSPQVKLWYVLLGRVLQPYQTENWECRFEVQSQVSPSISKPNALQGCRCVTLKALKSVQRTYFLKSSSKVQKSFSSHAVLDTGPVDMLCVLTPIFLVQSSWGHLQHWLATFD